MKFLGMLGISWGAMASEMNGISIRSWMEPTLAGCSLMMARRLSGATVTRGHSYCMRVKQQCEGKPDQQNIYCFLPSWDVSLNDSPSKEIRNQGNGLNSWATRLVPMRPLCMCGMPFDHKAIFAWQIASAMQLV
eukprot:6083503-Amphidinium_carterae.1